VARDSYANGAGSATNGITAGGYNGGLSPTNITNTEEWTAADFQIKTVTTS